MPEMIELGGYDAVKGEECNPSFDRTHVMVPEPWLRLAGWMPEAHAASDVKVIADGWREKCEQLTRERDEAHACLEAIAVYAYGAGPGSGLERGDTPRARHFALGRALLQSMRYAPRGVVPADLVKEAHAAAAAYWAANPQPTP